MSQWPGKYGYRIIIVGELSLHANDYYMTFDSFMSQSHITHIMHTEIIRRYKEYYEALYLQPYAIFMSPRFWQWYNDRTRIMKLMVYLPYEVIKSILDKEYEDMPTNKFPCYDHIPFLRGKP